VRLKQDKRAGGAEDQGEAGPALSSPLYRVSHAELLDAARHIAWKA